jgi:hypothetical protein
VSRIRALNAALLAGALLTAMACDDAPPPPTPLAQLMPTTVATVPPPQLLTFALSGAGDHVTGKIDYSSIPPYVIPPVGGPHAPYWLSCGVYDQPVPNENAVHDLEHGAVWITYQPDLPADVVATLRQMVNQGPKMLLSPYPGIPAPIIASAWGGNGKTGYQLRLYPGQYDELNSFIQRHSGATDAPEATATCSH